MSEDKEAFLDRWSRLKQQGPEEKPAVPETTEKKEETAPALQPIEDLQPDSDFTPFMNPQVDAGTRRAALKKLFTNAHFNAIDPFEPYSIDLTGEDPIPEEMLKTLNHAKRLLFDEKQQTAEAQAPGEAQASPQPQTEKTESDVAGKQDT